MEQTLCPCSGHFKPKGCSLHIQGRRHPIPEKNQVLRKIVQIMDYVTCSRRTRVSMQQMSKDLGIPRPTLYRLLDALVEAGCLVRTGDEYLAGPKVLGWAVQALNRAHVGRLARPWLEELARKSGLTASVHMRMGGARVCVDRVEGTSVVRPHVHIGEPLPLHLGASGKVLLAWFPEASRHALIRASCAQFPEHTQVPPEEIFAAVRSQGWALSLGERDEALASLSAPVFGPAGDVVAAISLSGVLQRFTDDNVAVWREQVVEAARAVSSCLGPSADCRAADVKPQS
jgi:DNA-binding IclR family transcriptional regulator